MRETCSRFPTESSERRPSPGNGGGRRSCCIGRYWLGLLIGGVLVAQGALVAARAAAPVLVPPAPPHWVYLEGRVIDAATDRPIPGAQVWLTGDAWNSRRPLARGGPMSGPPLGRRISDGVGRFVFGPVPRAVEGRSLHLHCLARGYVPLTIPVDSQDAPSDTVRVRMSMVLEEE